MRQPFALADPDELRDLVEAARLRTVEISQHTRTVSFGRPDGFARRLALATPLAETFADAPPDRRASILAHVTAAVRDACPGEAEISFPMSTNVALAVAS
jgi:hypothetical protein